MKVRAFYEERCLCLRIGSRGYRFQFQLARGLMFGVVHQPDPERGSKWTFSSLVIAFGFFFVRISHAMTYYH